MAAEAGAIDPMSQFRVNPVAGADWTILGHNIAFTNSAAFMVVERGFMDPRIVVVNGRPLSFRVRRNDKLNESSMTGGELSP